MRHSVKMSDTVENFHKTPMNTDQTQQDETSIENSCKIVESKEKSFIDDLMNNKDGQNNIWKFASFLKDKAQVTGEFMTIVEFSESYLLDKLPNIIPKLGNLSKIQYVIIDPTLDKDELNLRTNDLIRNFQDKLKVTPIPLANNEALEYVSKELIPDNAKLFAIFGIEPGSRLATACLMRELRKHIQNRDRILIQFQKGKEGVTNSKFEMKALSDSLGYLLQQKWENDFNILFLLSPSKIFELKKKEVVSQMESAWRFSDNVFGLLKPEGIFQKPISLRHPFLFYLGHLPAFANNHAMNGLLKLKPSVNENFDIIFERGIDPDVNDPSKCHSHSELPSQWPTVEQVLDYKYQVRKRILDTVENVLTLEDAPQMAQKGRVFSMIAEHDYMHAETLLYMYNNLKSEYKIEFSEEKLRYHFHKSFVTKGEMVYIPAGKVILGAKYTNIRFGWDNEFPEKAEEVAGFRMDRLPVTNGEFMKFVESGEYQNSKYWTPDNFEWKQKIGLSHPHSWNFNKEKSKWEIRTISGNFPIEMAIDWPVYVSQAEAQAYSNYVGKRLPTEGEYHRAAYGTPEGAIRTYPWGDEVPKGGIHGNFDFASMAPTPVGTYPKGQSAFGIYELIGNGWEWTSTIFDGFPGFLANIPNYPGYSADFFDGKHFVMLGASWATSVPLIRRSFRNWFQPNYQYTFSKFRCVSSL